MDAPSAPEITQQKKLCEIERDCRENCRRKQADYYGCVLSLATAARGRIMSQYIFLCVMHAFPLQSPGSDMPSADLPLPGVQSMLALTASLLLAFSDVEPLTATSFTPTLARTDAAFIKVTAQKLRINLAEYLYELRDSIMQTLAQTTLALSSSHHGAPTAVRSRSLGRI